MKNRRCLYRATSVTRSPSISSAVALQAIPDRSSCAHELLTRRSEVRPRLIALFREHLIGRKLRHRAAAPISFDTDSLQNCCGEERLSEIGEVLRHRHMDSTRIYAKVDLISLRELALPWPRGL